MRSSKLRPPDIDRGPVGTSVLRDLLGCPPVGEGERAEAVRLLLCGEVDERAWLRAWL